MTADAFRTLEPLADALTAVPVDDVFLEVRQEAFWRRRPDGGVVRRESARSGVAIRRDGSLLSMDGLDRMSLAELLGVSPRALPPITLPRPPLAPRDGRDLLAAGNAVELAWRWSWAALLRDGVASPIRRPVLAATVGRDGGSSLSIWPPPPAPHGAGIPALPAVRTPSRPTTVLLAPRAAAALFHEIAGHGLEADLAGRARAATPLGQPWFDLPVNIDDDPTRSDLPGAFDCDDEGVVAAPKRLVAAGRTAALLTDRATAHRLGTAGGNARRSDVHAPPRPRISNLIVSGPATDLEALRLEARVEVERIASGAFDPIGADVRLTAATAYRLHRGSRDGRLGPVRLRVPAAQVRGALAAVSAEIEATAEPGWCRKHGDVVPTAGVTPWILLTGVRLA